MNKYFQVYEKEGELRKSFSVENSFLILVAWIFIPIIVLVNLIDIIFFKKVFWVKESDFYKRKLKEINNKS